MSVEAPNEIKFQSISSIKSQSLIYSEKDEFQKLLNNEKYQYSDRVDHTPKSPKKNTIWLEYKSGSKENSQHAINKMVNLKSNGLLKFTQIQPFDNAFDSVLNSVKTASQVRHLIIRNSSLSVNHLQNVANVLKLNDGIAWLVLDHNKIDDRGVRHLADGIKKSSSVKHVVLADNEFGDNGLIALSQAVKQSKSIESLWLQGNKIGDIGADILAMNIENHVSLKTLDIRGNKISSSKRQLLTMVCERNGIRCYT